VPTLRSPLTIRYAQLAQAPPASAKAIVSTVAPNASGTPAKAMP